MNKLQALAKYLECDEDELSMNTGSRFIVDGIEYLVLTDDEADDAIEEYLENYLEECIYSIYPTSLTNYFDEEKWLRDARLDGRGVLSFYDGEEIELEGEYYAYRR